MSVDLKGLLGKLNATVRNALESGAGLCVSRTHYDIEVEHYLAKLLDATDSDFVRIALRFGVDKSRLTSELMRSIDKLKTGNARTPAFSPTLVKMFSEAWALGSINYNSYEIRSGTTILALLSEPDLARLTREISRELQRIDLAALRNDFISIVAGSPEDVSTVAGPTAGFGSPVAGGKTPNLDQFTVNLTENAKRGKIDNVLGRDTEIRQMVDILTRRRQNNPILTGEAGVGKTAVVEGFALRVVAGDVPPPLRNVTIRTLDLALLQAGAGVKGEFENRLKGLIEEVKSSPTPIILFIDEAHTMIGAGGSAGQGDAANLLKPALARGELRTIAATTWSEYKKYFEKDAALARRFQVVKVEEPDETRCMVMMRGIVPALEKHHKVRILDEAVAAGVKLSNRYLAGRQLPDKAVSILDTACARLALGQNTTPAAMEDATRWIDDLTVQQRVLERESNVGADHVERLQTIAKQRATAETKLAELRVRWEKESGLVTRIREIRGQLEEVAAAPAAAAPAAQGRTDTVPAPPATEVSPPAAAGQSRTGTVLTPAAGEAPAAAAAAPAPVAAAPTAPAATPSAPPAELRAELIKLTAELAALQGENPLIGVTVDAQIVGEVLSGWTGIPVGKMVKDEIQTILELPQVLGSRVIGQQLALEAISQRISTAKAGLDDPGKPIGVFMLIGPSGVGKTETALTLSDLLYGGERNLITINMSEFQEPHTVSTLKGSPPGYVGYGEGGVLTEAVRRRPYSVVLLDEVEKAHPDVLELFYQVFDKGKMEDGEGREIDFKNTIIILTTNACTDMMMKLTADPDTAPTAEGLVKAMRPDLNKIFKPAFLGRMVIIPFYPVRDETLRKIVVLKLAKIRRRLQESHKIDLLYEDDLVAEVAKRCTEVESGARNVDNILTNTLLPDVARRILNQLAEGRKPESVRVGVGQDGQFVYA